MVAETIPLENITRLYLLKHHLFKKAKQNQVVKVVKDISGLHAQASTTPYLSLWNRVENFENESLDNALYRDRSLVKTWVMRGTLHIIPSQDLPIYNRALRRMWLEHHGRYMRAPDWPSPEERRNLIHPKILEALAGRPLKRKELNAKIQLLLKDDSKPYQRLFSGWGGILKETAYKGLTVHAQPCDRESCFARLDKWLPEINLESMDEESAQKRLVIKYLNGYGPATQRDFCLWSGMMASEAERAIEDSSRLLEEVKVEGKKERFLMLRDDVRALDSMSSDEKAPACLLPKFDSILLGHKDRTRIVRDKHSKRVFKKAGDVAATVLINSQVVGTWRQKKSKNTLMVIITPFVKISKEDMQQVEERANELGQYLGLDESKLSVTR